MAPNSWSRSSARGCSVGWDDPAVTPGEGCGKIAAAACVVIALALLLGAGTAIGIAYYAGRAALAVVRY